eukprot:scaffold49911_cov95-Phaeocystis_antarctica.AAC.2
MCIHLKSDRLKSGRQTEPRPRVPRPRVCLSSVWCVPPRTHLPDRGVTRNKRQVTRRQTQSCCRRVILCIPDTTAPAVVKNKRCEGRDHRSKDRSSVDNR